MPTPLTAADIEQLCATRGFTGTIESISIVEDDDRLPDAQHDRVVLMDVLQALFKDADSDQDGRVSKSDLSAFIARYSLEHVTGLTTVYLDLSEDDALGFDDFKAALLRCRLITLQDNSDAGAATEYGVHDSLVQVCAVVFFASADRDGDGTITLDEVELMFEKFGLGGAVDAFEQYDADGSGGIDKEEFVRLLLGEKVLAQPAATSMCAIL